MRKLLVVLALVLLPLAPVRAQFCPGVAPWVFVDVPASHAFCTYVTWMAQNNVTLGCRVIDANNREYCPDDSVSRLQMAAFMNRLGDALFPLTCAAGQVMKWNGLAWVCADDATSGGAPNAFVFGGNAFGTTAVLGTTDVQPLDIRVNNSRVMRYEPNSISPNVIGGGPGNSVTAGVRGATIAGGGVPAGLTDPDFLGEAPNRVTDAYGTVGGGFANRAGDDAGTTIDRAFATVGGGRGNTASNQYSTVGGGDVNDARGLSSTVGGGAINIASGYYSTVGGGVGNTASFHYSTVGGGSGNAASGDFSWAGGRQARTQTAGATPVPHHGAFVWADSSDFNFNSTADNQFSVRSTGGVRFVTAIDGFGTPTAGVSLAPGDSAWAALSDRAAKENWVDVDGHNVLDRLVAMPIGWWNYKAQSADVRHIGPTAQDFRAAFGLGRGDTTIATIDADGVALAAIQGLNAKLEARVAAKDAEIGALKREMAELRLAVEVLMARTSTEGRVAQTR